MSIKNKIIWIAGGSTGIGKASAKKFIKEVIQKLAKKYEVERAPFFIVEDEQNSITIYTVYFKFIKEIFGGKTTESDIAKDILDADNNLDFI